MTRFRPLWLPLVFACALVLVCSLRFNRYEIIPLPHFSKHSPNINLGDAAKYVAYVEFFRGQEIGDRLYAPFSYRPLAPFLASFLPFRPMTALNILNILFLLMALYFLDRMLSHLKCHPTFRAAGASLFVFSFPTFYYGAIGYVDPVGITFLIAGTYYALRERWLAFGMALVLGTLTKETTVILLPVAAARLLYNWNSQYRKLLLIGIFCVCYTITILAIRRWAPGYPAFAWTPTWATLARNLSRPGALITPILTFGLPGVMALLALPKLFRDRNKNLPELIALLAGFVAALLVLPYSSLSAYLEGRFVWLIYPFAIPIAILDGSNGLSGAKTHPQGNPE